MDTSLSELWEMVIDREAWCAVIHVVEKSRTRLSDRTELNWTESIYDHSYTLLSVTEETVLQSTHLSLVF